MEAEQEPDRGRLARAVRPEEPVHLAFDEGGSALEGHLARSAWSGACLDDSSRPRHVPSEREVPRPRDGRTKPGIV